MHKATSECGGGYKGENQDPESTDVGETGNFSGDGQEGLSEGQIFHSSPD